MIRTAIIAATLLSTTAVAETNGFLGWSGKADANLLMSQGNTDKSTYGAALEASKAWGVWSLDLNASANGGRTNGTRDTEDYAVGAQGNRQVIDENTYAFASANYKVDNFSGYNYIADQTVGMGRTFVKNDNYSLKGQLGFGVQETETDTGVESTDFVTKPELNIAWQATDSLQFTQDFKASITSDLTILNSRTALRNHLGNNIYLQAAYEVENKSEVPAGVKETDSKTTLGLSYDF